MTNFLPLGGAAEKSRGRPRKDLTGLTYGNLTVVEFLNTDRQGSRWVCQCRCGQMTVTRGSKLTSGWTKSCGCGVILAAVKTIASVNARRPPPMKDVSGYRSWVSMWERCTVPSNPSFKHYGGRGIGIDPRWESFEVFIKDMGPRPSRSHSIDRCNNSLGYTPGNCRWATQSQQMNNTRRSVHIEFDGRTQTITEWSKELGISSRTLWSRIRHYGWSVERALTTPVLNKRNQK